MQLSEQTMAWFGLLAASLVVAVLALLAFKWCSNQSALRRRRDRAFARLLELQLFKEDLLGIFGTFGRILAAVGAYLAATLRPLAVLILPLGFLIVQLAGWFQFRPLKPDESALLTVRLDEAHDPAAAAVTVKTSAGLEIETAPFVSTRDREIVWRIRPLAALPDGWAEVTINGVALRKTVSASTGGLVHVSAARVRGHGWPRLLHPFEPPLPGDGPARAVAVSYPSRPLHLGSHPVNWLLALLVLSLLFGAVLKHPLRVEI